MMRGVRLCGLRYCRSGSGARFVIDKIFAFDEMVDVHRYWKQWSVRQDRGHKAGIPGGRPEIRQRIEALTG